MKIINQKSKLKPTTIIVMTMMMVIAAITATITITTMIDDNPFTNIQKAYAQLQQQPIVGPNGLGPDIITGDNNLSYPPGNQNLGVVKLMDIYKKYLKLKQV